MAPKAAVPATAQPAVAPAEPAVAAAAATVGVPLSVVGPVDLGRMIRELEAIDEYLTQLSLRSTASGLKMPKTSKLMDETIALNKLNLLQPADRQQLAKLLASIKAEAPVIHISFSADPSPVFVSKLMFWLREQIHPNLLLTVGLQPNIGAGCMVRTTNKYFDFSLRANFAKHADLLLAKMQEAEA